MMEKVSYEPLFYLEESGGKLYTITSRDARAFRDLLKKGFFSGLADFLMTFSLPCYLLPTEEPENDI